MWPIEKTIPRLVMSLIEEVIEAISGAAVISLMLGARVELVIDDVVGLMFEDPYMSSKSSKPWIAARRTEGLWIPFLVGDRKGPSQCAPSDSAPSWGKREMPDGPRNGRACFVR